VKLSHSSNPLGNLEFEAEFFPCANLKDVSFKIPDPAASRIVEEGDKAGSIAETASINESFVSPATSPVGIAHPPSATTNGSASTTASATSKTNGAGSAGLSRVGSIMGKEKAAREGITMSKQELMRSQTGVLAFQVSLFTAFRVLLSSR